MHVLYCCIISKTILLRLANLDICSPSSGVMTIDLMGSSKRRISHALSCPKPRPYNELYIGPAVTFTLPTSISNYMPVGRTQCSGSAIYGGLACPGWDTGAETRAAPYYLRQPSTAIGRSPDTHCKTGPRSGRDPHNSRPLRRHGSPSGDHLMPHNANRKEPPPPDLKDLHLIH